MAAIVRYNVDGTDLVQDGSAPLLLWLQRFPLKVAWNRTQVSAFKDRRLTDMGPSLYWTDYLWPANSILSVQWAQCVNAWLLNCKGCLRSATIAVCKMQRHGMSWYSNNPALSTWHIMHPLRLCQLCVTWGELWQMLRVTHVIWFVTSVTCNACVLVCDECHISRVWYWFMTVTCAHVSWFVTSVTCNACDLICDEYHMWRMLPGLWRVSHVTHVILVCDECHM
jgi:hypothetical protein